MKNKNKMKISVEQIMVINRTISRNMELENGRVNHHKAHKMATDYNRKRAKRVDFDE